MTWVVVDVVVIVVAMVVVEVEDCKWWWGVIGKTTLVVVRSLDNPSTFKFACYQCFELMLTDGRTDGHTDGHTDGRTDKPSYRDARTHLKMIRGGW